MAKKKTAKKEAPVTADEMPVEEYDATRYTPWIPGNMPVGGKSNSTEQLNDHPTEHNHSAEAISDIVDRFADLRLYVPAANSCGVDGALKVDGQIQAAAGSYSAPAITIGGVNSGFYGGAEYVATNVNGITYFGVYPDRTQVFNDLKVNGNINLLGAIYVDGGCLTAKGTAAAPAHSFYNDTTTGMFLTDTGVLSLAAEGQTAMNIGLEGVAFPGLHDKTWDGPPNVFVTEDGRLLRSTYTLADRVDTADLTRLESVIETLTARIEQLEARLETGATDA